MADKDTTIGWVRRSGAWRADFGGIVAGACVAVASGLTLLSLGAAVGLTAVDPGDGSALRDVVVGGGAWTLVSIVTGTLLGAIASVRLGAYQDRGQAACQGFCTWATAFVGSLFCATLLGALAGVLPPEPLQEGVAAPVETGAVAGWGFFATALLAAFAGAVGGVWGLPPVTGDEERPSRFGEPLRPADV
jgi:hypothetical protein